MEEFLTKHRGLIILVFVLPVSFIVNCISTLRNWFFRTFLATHRLHDKKVKEIQAQVKRWRESGSKKPMCTARPSWHTMSTRTASFKKDCNQIAINLKNILSLDTKNLTVRLEPLVNMGYITQYLLPKGYALAIQVEMEDLTIGGVCMGAGMETTSHRLGLIQETVVAFEMVLSDGRLVRASKDENTDLYYALPWSHGTLGFLVAVEVKIVPIKPYIHTTYIPCHSQEEYCTKMKELAEADDAPEFLEATVYSKDKAVIMASYFADKPTTSKEKKKINRINYWFKPWYYKYVESFLKKGQADEYIPLRHYYHRYTRSVFWEMENLIPFSNSSVYKWLFGWLGAPKVSFLKYTMSKAVRKDLIQAHVVQDIIIPISEMRYSIDLFHDIFNIYPLLVFPIRIYDHGHYQGFLRKPPNPLPGKNYQMYFDLGAYGLPAAVKQNKSWSARDAVRKMEKYTRDVTGYQLLYADTFMTREEFKQMFDHTLYDQMRIKYNAEGAFPRIYDKIVPEHQLTEQ